jgi:hypothetical protein
MQLDEDPDFDANEFYDDFDERIKQRNDSYYVREPTMQLDRRFTADLKSSKPIQAGSSSLSLIHKGRSA